MTVSQRSAKKRVKVRLSSVLIGILFGQCAFLLILGLTLGGYFELPELTAYDFMYWVAPRDQRRDDRIVMVEYTDAGIRQYGWPLPDRELVDLFKILLAQSPRVIGLDLYRDLPVDSRDGGHFSDPLNAIFEAHDNIIGIMKISDEKGVFVAPQPTLWKKDQVGFNDMPADDAGIIRRGLLFMVDPKAGDDAYYNYFGLLLALKYLAAENVFLTAADTAHPTHLKLGKALIKPLDQHFGGYRRLNTADYQVMFSYPLDAYGFPRLTISDVLAGKTPPNFFQDKIVIVGVNAESTPDFFYTPFSRWHKDEQRIPGIYLHGFAVRQFLDWAEGTIKPMAAFPEWVEQIWLWVCCTLGGLTCAWGRKHWKKSLLILLGAPVIWGIGFALFLNAIWAPTVSPVMGWITAAVMTTYYLASRDRRQKRFIHHAFNQYLSPHVINTILEDPSTLALGGEERDMTAFFSDVKSFSQISEKLSPQELVNLLNDYLTEMCNIIMRYHGTIDKFEGDAIIAFWGAPIVQPDHALLACQAGFEMQERLKSLRKKWHLEGRPLLHVRIGLNSGKMVVGNMGAKHRMDYTIMGDAVNLASRLEGINKFYQTWTLISHHTYHQLRDAVFARELDTIRVLGKKEPITIYEVLGNPDRIDATTRKKADIYAKGLAAYRQKAYPEAVHHFEAVLALGNDGPASAMRTRCLEYLKSPPAPDWDGVYQFLEKG